MKAESNASEEESGEGIRLCQAECKKYLSQCKIIAMPLWAETLSQRR